LHHNLVLGNLSNEFPDRILLYQAVDADLQEHPYIGDKARELPKSLKGDQ
jgi:hypothetical protein